MVKDTRDGTTMYILFKKEIKTFNISCLNNGDCIVIEHREGQKSESDYFISTVNYKATVTTRCNIIDIPSYKQPYFLQDFITEIQLRLNELKAA